MKKKKLIGKLSLDKSRISALDSAKIKGGTSTITPSEDSDVFCIASRNNGCSNITCDIGCQHLTNTEGSACKCL